MEDIGDIIATCWDIELQDIGDIAVEDIGDTNYSGICGINHGRGSILI